MVQLYYNKKYEATTLKIIESTNENVANEFLNLFNKGEIQIKEINNEIKSNNKCIKAYVDGSYDNKIKRYGSGIVIIDDNNIGEYYCYGENEELLKYRNISGEIIATLIALEYAKQNHVECMEIYYDYSGIENWALGYWKTNNYLTKRYKELFDKYINDYTLKVIFRKVKAHSGNNYNEIADKLAKKALFERKCNVEKFFVNV
ncbi:hypothetical protein LN42_03865 [Marinitoga sp. 1137]|nr:hypothetical protein LN42_03865 [Marinitoga sp. 1137]